MPNLLYDSINADNIPADAQLMMGYINGNPAWRSYYPMVARFGPSKVLSITVAAFDSTGTPIAADILDVEKGDASPSDVPRWVTAMRALSRPVVTAYCSRLNTWPPTVTALKTAHVSLPDFIIADQTNKPHLVPGSVATQYTDTGLVDISLIDGSWPLSSAIPSPPLPPIQTFKVGSYMLSTVAIQTDANGNGWLPTPHPWSSFCAGTIEGSDPDPAADDAYWPGTCKVQQRNGTILVSVVGCLPSTIQNVYVLTA